MASTVKDAALSLRETVSCEDVIARLAPHVTLRKNGAGLCGPCPFCGGDDRFYITPDRSGAACTHCHDRRMDSVGLAAWILDCTMHEAVDVLSGHKPYSQLPAPPATPKTRRTDEDNAYNATWRSKVAGEAQDRHYRLQADATGAASARSYLLSRGLAPDTWQAFTVGYQEKTHVTGTQRTAPAISWPVCTQDGSTYGVKYRFLEAQDTGADKPLRYTMRKGSVLRDTDALFGAQLLYADATRRYRALVFCEGEINAMSIWQACNVAGVDVLSFGSEAQTELPPWAIDYASGYGCAIVWLDAEDKSAKVASQLRHLPHVARLRSPLRENVKADANACLVDGRLGALVQAARFHILPPAQHESVVWQIWDVRHLLDEGQVRIAQKVAERTGVSW